jgi:hypothetical protein
MAAGSKPDLDRALSNFVDFCVLCRYESGAEQQQSEQASHGHTFLKGRYAEEMEFVPSDNKN